MKSRDDEADLVVAADGDMIYFEITDKLSRQHGITRMPFRVDIDDSDALHRVLHSSADFHWYPRHSSRGNILTGSTLECMWLEETGEYTDGLMEILMPDPNGHNLNVGGVIIVDVNGFKITNPMSIPFYVSMFYFDVSDLSISLYYQPGIAKKNVDVSLPPRESLAIGYGTSRTAPHIYTPREGQDVDVGYLKLFFSTEYLDWSGVVQESLFTGFRGGARAAPGNRRFLDYVCWRCSENET